MIINKYFSVFKICFLEYLSYRLNFVLWRFRSVVSILITYYLWQSVYSGSENILGYQRPMMMTYILMINFISSIAQSTQTFKIASEINYGLLSVILLKPINYFGYNISRDFSDKVINFLSSILEICILFYLLKAPFFLQTDMTIIVYFLITCIISSVLFFEINLLLSFISFWSKDSWAPRFIFYILVAFLSGSFFPLDILSAKIFQIMTLLPFTYLIFFPIKIYLGNFSPEFFIKGIISSSLWIIILLFFVNIVWNKGLKTYTAEEL